MLLLKIQSCSCRYYFYFPTYRLWTCLIFSFIIIHGIYSDHVFKNIQLVLISIILLFKSEDRVSWKGTKEREKKFILCIAAQTFNFLRRANGCFVLPVWSLQRRISILRSQCVYIMDLFTYLKILLSCESVLFQEYMPKEVSYVY